MIYYFLVNTGIIQYINGIHGRLYGDTIRSGCFLINMKKQDINPFDNKHYINIDSNKEMFMNFLMYNNMANKILFIDDNNENIKNNNITVFSHEEFQHEGYGLTEKCCDVILNY